MTNEDFKRLDRGDIIRHSGDSSSYVVMANYGNYVLAVDHVHATQPHEWTLVSKANYSNLPRTTENTPSHAIVEIIVRSLANDAAFYKRSHRDNLAKFSLTSEGIKAAIKAKDSRLLYRKFRDAAQRFARKFLLH